MARDNVIRRNHVSRRNHVTRMHGVVGMLSGTLAVLLSQSTACADAGPAFFDDDQNLQARIVRTTYGVPHIYADNVESLAFGMGYAYAEDNVCLQADQMVRFNSNRSLYFGPDKVAGSGDSQNLISDFAYKAFGIRQQADQHFSELSDATRSRLQGYAAGYNQYLADTGVDAIDPSCAGRAWIKPIDGIDVLTNVLGIALLASGTPFMEQVFLAHPGDAEEYLPAPILSEPSTRADLQPRRYGAGPHRKGIGLPLRRAQHLGSNGWGLGADMTENQRGALLANPHFPHTGGYRFWESHLVIPGQLDVMGGTLAGMPGIINIGFNEDIAWTHTFSTAEHFIVYELELDPSDRTRYLFEGRSLPMTKRTLTIDVTVEPGVVVPFSKDMYESRFGPIVETPAEFAFLSWDDDSAYALKDVNSNNLDVIDHWAAINTASSLQEFQQTFVDFDGMMFCNAVYADREGNSFFIDDGPAPLLSDEANALLDTDAEIAATRAIAGFHILPGNDATFDFHTAVPSSRAPQLARKDFVQNANDSFWSTNPEAPLEGFSRLFGAERRELSLRTRMGLRLLKDSAGEDGKFSLGELEGVLLGDRAYLGELVLDELVERCEAQGTEPVVIDDGTPIDVSEGCTALSQWNGSMGKDSVGAIVLREFSYKFDTLEHLDVPFDFTDPANTPHTLRPAGEGGDAILKALASAVANIRASGWSVSAPLGELQFVEKSTFDGAPSGERLPWAGASGQEGGFSVFWTFVGDDGSLLPRHTYTPILDVDTRAELGSGLAEEGYHVVDGSSWMFVLQFTETGPEARGLLTYSQSRNSESDWFDDQTRLYSKQQQLRPLLYRSADIEQNAISSLVVERRSDCR